MVDLCGNVVPARFHGVDEGDTWISEWHYGRCRIEGPWSRRSCSTVAKIPRHLRVALWVNLRQIQVLR